MQRFIAGVTSRNTANIDSTRSARRLWIERAPLHHRRCNVLCGTAEGLFEGYSRLRGWIAVPRFMTANRASAGQKPAIDQQPIQNKVVPVVRQRSAKPLFVGSIPTRASSRRHSHGEPGNSNALHPSLDAWILAAEPLHRSDEHTSELQSP